MMPVRSSLELLPAYHFSNSNLFQMLSFVNKKTRHFVLKYN